MSGCSTHSRGLRPHHQPHTHLLTQLPPRFGHLVSRAAEVGMSQRQRGRPARAPFSGPVPLARPPALEDAGWQGVAVSPSRENHLRQKWGLVQKHPAHSSWTAHSQDRPAWVTKDQGPPGGNPGCSSPPRLRARLPPGERSPHSTACWSRPPLAVLLWVTPAAPRAGREPVTHPHHPALSSQTPGVNSPRTPDDTSTPGPTNRRPILSPSVRLMPRDTTPRELRPPSPPRALPLPAELLSDGVSSRHQRRPTRRCQPPGKPPGDFHSI